MATQKALYTNKSDFNKEGAGYGEFVVNPFLFHDAETNYVGNFTWNGTAPTSGDYTSGMRGSAVKIARTRQMLWRGHSFPASSKYMVSLWVKPTANDVKSVASGGQSFAILATNRGDGFSNKGFHLAINNDPTYGSVLNARQYNPSTGAVVDMYSTGATGTTLFNFTADTWTHIVIVYDSGATNKMKVFANGNLIMWNATNANLSVGWTTSFTVGDMLGTSNVKFEGEVDEVIFAYGNDVWSDATITQYYNDVKVNKKMVDFWTNPGAIQLAKTDATNYTSSTVTWLSPVVDLGAPFDSFGRVQITSQKPGGAQINVFTRTGDSAASLGAWTALREDGSVMSANNRYLQIKIDLSTTFLSVTPVVEEVQVLDYAKTLKFSLTHEPLRVYKDKASGLEPMGELKNAYDIIINEEINGEDTLTFKLPINDPKRRELGAEPVELIAEIADRQYTIKEATDKRETDGRLYTEFNCEALWYELRDFKVKSIDLKATTAYQALSTILSSSLVPTGWTLGRVEIPSTKTRDIKDDWKSVLELFRKVVDKFGGELTFDIPSKQVHLLEAQGDDNGVRFFYNKNLTNITRTIDTYDLVTRLYAYGAGTMGISTVNGGIEYVEDYTWVDALGLRNRVRIGYWKDDNYTVPQNLFDDANILLADAAKPRFAYSIAVQDLSSLSGHEHESFGLGDTVYTVDKDLFVTETKFEVVSRIVSRKYNVREPWKTTVELNQPKRMLADAVKRAVDDKLDYLAATDPLSTTESSQMTVFNNLLNSRADEGINADWLAGGDGSGFLPSNAGFSGDWSFKVTGAYGKTNTLTQRVYGVSHRSAYTVSAAVAKDGIITRGGTLTEPFVGIKVVIHYKDGTSETKLLEVPDATQGS